MRNGRGGEREVRRRGMIGEGRGEGGGGKVREGRVEKGGWMEGGGKVIGGRGEGEREREQEMISLLDIHPLSASSYPP